MYNILTTAFVLILLISCSKTTNKEHKQTKDKQVETRQNNNTIQKEGGIRKIPLEEETRVIPERTNCDSFEIAYLHYHQDCLARVFVVIDTANVYNRSIIQAIIGNIQTLFEVEQTSNISFFSEKKYADYKTDLFIYEEHSLPIEEYDNWMNYYYLAEYDFETRKYQTFPSTQIDYQRQKMMTLECE